MRSRLHSDLYPTYDVRVFPGSRVGARGIKIRTCSRLFGVFNITITVVICVNTKRLLNSRKIYFPQHFRCRLHMHHPIQYLGS